MNLHQVRLGNSFLAPVNPETGTGGTPGCKKSLLKFSDFSAMYSMIVFLKGFKGIFIVSLLIV